ASTHRSLTSASRSSSPHSSGVDSGCAITGCGRSCLCSPEPASARCRAGRRLGSAYPDRRPSEYRQSNIAAQVEEIALRSHLAAVSASAPRVVELPAMRVLRVDFHEARTDLQSTERSAAQLGVGIV